MGDLNIEPMPLVQEGKKADQLTHFKELSAGAGSTILKQDRNGLFVGGTNFENAPWAVDYEGNQYVGANGEIVLDGPNKKITIGASNEIVIDGVAKTITTNYIKDSTYGLYGVFVKTARLASGGGDTTVTLVADNGGLMNVAINYTTNTDAIYKLLPGFNVSTLTSYYNIIKSGGNYVVNLYRSDIEAEVSGINYYYITAFFNSLETNGW